MATEESKKAAVDHFAWPVLAGMAGPFVLGVLSKPFQVDGFVVGDLVRGGELHLSTAAMLLATVPQIMRAADSSGWSRLFWSVLAVAALLLMLGAVVVWASIVPQVELSDDEWRMAWEGGLWGMLLAAFLSSALVWKAS